MTTAHRRSGARQDTAAVTGPGDKVGLGYFANGTDMAGGVDQGADPV
ncbi:hypothetical protein ACFC26_16655 [Kitasatospora purpeofusca]